jgi:hypothetical protein
MSCVKAAGFFISLCVLCMLANTSYAADTAPAVKQYEFELETLNSGDKVRKRRTSFAGGAVEFKIAAAMTDDELAFVNNLLDDFAASPLDDEGYRNFTMSNGTRVRVGGFKESEDVAGAAVQSLPVEFSVQGEFSPAEAAVVLQIAAEGNLFVTSSSDPTLAATTAQVADKRFLKSHKNYSVTPDENALAEWIRRNIAPNQQAKAANPNTGTTAS